MAQLLPATAYNDFVSSYSFQALLILDLSTFDLFPRGFIALSGSFCIDFFYQGRKPKANASNKVPKRSAQLSGDLPTLLLSLSTSATASRLSISPKLHLYPQDQTSMCLFIYTLPQQCGHKYFQNVSECPIARGIAPTTENRMGSTLPEPKFLFDTSRSRTHTPELYSRIFACKKQKAIRPVPTLCDKCVKDKERKIDTGREVVMTDRLLVPSLGNGARSESSGSLVALFSAGPSTSSTSSSLDDTSGMSALEGLR